MPKTPHDQYLHIGRAADLSGSDRVLYRVLETVPGALSVGTLLLFVVLSFFAPSIVAYFTIAFAAYWLFKTIFLTAHLRYSFKRLTHNLRIDWTQKLANTKHDDIVHVVILPFFKEPYEVLVGSVRAIKESSFSNKHIAVVLASEEAGGERAFSIAKRIEKLG